jgi:hypothetical protein
MTQQAELIEQHEVDGNVAGPGFLDRPLVSFMRLNWETAIWIAIFVVSASARLWMLDVRAMSHDESLHSLYSYYLYANGNYDHNPMMHGPFRYHVSAFIYFPLWRQRLHRAPRPGRLWHGRALDDLSAAPLHRSHRRDHGRDPGCGQPDAPLSQPLHPRRHLHGLLYARLDLRRRSLSRPAANCATWDHGGGHGLWFLPRWRTISSTARSSAALSPGWRIWQVMGARWTWSS